MVEGKGEMMDTYYRLVNGELVDVSIQLYHHHEQLEKERDIYEKRAVGFIKELEVAIKERDQWKQKAVRFARVAQQKIYDLYDGKASYMDDVEYKEAQTIIDKAEGEG